MAIHGRIREAREQAGLSQTELARLLGVTRSACSQWESDQGTAPRRERLVQLANVLDVSFEWLATGNGSATDATPGQALDAMLQLQPDQKELLSIYRRLSARQRIAVLEFLRNIGE